jgi:hypothetical protein
LQLGDTSETRNDHHVQRQCDLVSDPANRLRIAKAWNKQAVAAGAAIPARALDCFCYRAFWRDKRTQIDICSLAAEIFRANKSGEPEPSSMLMPTAPASTIAAASSLTAPATGCDRRRATVLDHARASGVPRIWKNEQLAGTVQPAKFFDHIVR